MLFSTLSKSKIHTGSWHACFFEYATADQFFVAHLRSVRCAAAGWS